tara:strand:- start:508 stop:1056 length:549 start_codon:yes stop_codon:yes gene_type:complete
MISNISEDMKDWAIGWYCLRSKPRMERVAYASLDSLNDVKVFLPRTRRVSKKSNLPLKPLFPGYFFAQFDPIKNMRSVHFARGVAYVIKCKDIPVQVPSDVMVELHRLSPSGILEVPDKPHEVGDEVKAIAGLFKGDKGNVTQLIPSRQRIKVLFEILGRDTEIEIGEEDVEFPSDHPIGSI